MTRFPTLKPTPSSEVTPGPNPTVGVCWDADRLNLWRVEIKPDPRFLSTQPARSEERIVWARDLQQEHFAWKELKRAFGLR